MQFECQATHPEEALGALNKQIQYRSCTSSSAQVTASPSTKSDNSLALFLSPPRASSHSSESHQPRSAPSRSRERASRFSLESDNDTALDV